MNSKFLRLDTNDFIKGVVVAVLAAVFTTLATTLNTPGFDFATFNWGELIKVAMGAFVAYIAKNLVTDQDGKLGGIL